MKPVNSGDTGRVSGNPFRLPPIRIRCHSLRVKATRLHVAALVLAVSACAVYVFLADRSTARFYGHIAFVTASLLLTWAGVVSWRAQCQQRPRWAWVRLAYEPLPKLVRLKLDMDAAEYTYRARPLLRRNWWIPASLITGITVSAFGEHDIVVFGPLTYTYHDAVSCPHTMHGQ